jgi:hypothetical protein
MKVASTTPAHRPTSQESPLGSTPFHTRCLMRCTWAAHMFSAFCSTGTMAPHPLTAMSSPVSWLPSDLFLYLDQKIAAVHSIYCICVTGDQTCCCCCCCCSCSLASAFVDIPRNWDRCDCKACPLFCGQRGEKKANVEPNGSRVT